VTTRKKKKSETKSNGEPSPLGVLALLGSIPSTNSGNRLYQKTIAGNQKEERRETPVYFYEYSNLSWGKPQEGGCKRDAKRG